MEFELAPERRSISNEMRPASFEVEFRDGKTTHWGFYWWSSAPREAKPQGENLCRLNLKLPGEGVADNDFGTVRWIEKIELFLKDGFGKPHAQDYGVLISLICSCSTAADESALIEANCAVVKTLAEGFPEVEELRKTAKDGKISLLKLSDLVKPYITGEKTFPESMVDPK